jgi:hypothetical protein
MTRMATRSVQGRPALNLDFAAGHQPHVANPFTEFASRPDRRNDAGLALFHLPHAEF